MDRKKNVHYQVSGITRLTTCTGKSKSTPCTWSKTMKQILNLTPHTLVVGGNEIKSSGIARVSETSALVRTENTPYGRIPVFRTEFGHVIDLPEEKPDTLLVVSAITARAAMQENPNRRDIYVPGKQIRDDQGRIVGCEGIAIY